MFLLSALFAAMAATLPTCQPAQVTNCSYAGNGHVWASVQTTDATVYFELTDSSLTDLEVYPSWKK